jgi:multicomponent Na+:H+ antiporter subunit C
VTVLAYGTVGWLLLIGLYGIVSSHNLIHAVICLTIVQSSTYVLLLSIGYRRGAAAPIFADIPADRSEIGQRAVDPIVQALTLTDVVVEATVVALMLALAVQAHKRFKTLDPNELRPLRG